MSPKELSERLKTLGPGTEVQVVDLTGTQDHFQAVIVSSAFQGKSMIEQHRMVFSLFKSEVDSNEVHALSLKTYTPEQYKKISGN